MLHRQFLRGVLAVAGVIMLAGCGSPQTAEEQTAARAEIDATIQPTLERLYAEVPGTREVASEASGMLVFPDVLKGGAGIGGEYGRGALVVGGNPVDYYSISGGSLGLQLGAEERSIVIMFMTPEALQNFQNSNGWSVGADASASIPNNGTGGKVSSAAANQPVIAYVFGHSGLMFNASLEGTRISKLDLGPVPAPAPAPQAAPPPPPAPQQYLVFFDFNSATLTPEARDIVRNAAENARAGGLSSIVVTGHTDTAGPADYNMRLSQRRAEAVAQELVSLGVGQPEITVHAVGETQPLVPTGDGVREPQNRRVEIVLQHAAM